MKVCIKNLGCKVNQYECEFMASLFEENNDEIVLDNADVFIINTCTVTNTSDAKSRKLIRKIRRENPESILVAVGCFTQNLKEKAKEIIDADIIIGNKDKSKVVELVYDFVKNKKQIVSFSKLNEDFENMEMKRHESITRAYIKIQDGCENFCSYCIIPYVRGKVRSKKKEDVLREINTLVNLGHKEIVLTGIHTGHYGSDIKNYKLSNLIKDILKNKDLKLLRISSIEITELDKDIFDLFENEERIANHFHVPLQSGCDKTLKDMNRKYDTKYFLDKINNLRKIRKDVSITTDVIVGFPGETEEDFEETYNFCKKVNFSKIHVFPYSDREGTKASKMDNHIHSKTIKERTKKLLDLSLELEKKFILDNLNKEIDVLIEEVKDGFSIGHSSNYLKICLHENLKINEIYKVKLNNYNSQILVGELIKVLN